VTPPEQCYSFFLVSKLDGSSLDPRIVVRDVKEPILEHLARFARPDVALDRPEERTWDQRT